MSWSFLKSANITLQLVRLSLSFLLVTVIPAAAIPTPSPTNTVDSTLHEHLDLFGKLTKDCTLHKCDEDLNVQHLQSILSNMNTEVDPCVDFYQYACGNWDSAHPNVTDTLTITYQRFLGELVFLFERWRQDEENEVSHESTEGVKEKMLKYYKACLSMEAGEQPTLQSYLDHMRDQWGLWDENNFDWLSTLAELGHFGYKGHFLQFEFFPNRTHMNLELKPHDDSSNLTWSESIYEALQGYTDKDIEQLEEELREFEDNLLAALSAERDTPDYTDSDIENATENDTGNDTAENYTTEESAVTFENETEEPETEAEKATGRTVTLAELEDDSGNIVSLSSGLEKLIGAPVKASREDWSEFVSAVIGRPVELYRIDWSLYLRKLLGRPVEATEKFMVTNLEAIRRVSAFLERSNSTTVLLYSMARFLGYLQKTEAYINTEKDLNSTCVDHMYQVLPLPMSYLYELEYFGVIREQHEAITGRMFNSLREEFKSILQENAMDFGSQELNLLLQKIDTMRLNIGGLPANATARDYNDYISGLEVSETDFTHNHLSALRLFASNTLAAVGKSSSSSPLFEFHQINSNIDEVITYSPYYLVDMNAVHLPHTYFQLPSYSGQFWDSLLYGELAFTLGHEIVHAFDKEGVMYDAAGKVSPLYSAILSNANFNASTACLEDGTEFLNERICDVSGAHLALRTAMRQTSEGHRNERLLFLKFSQYFCGSPDTEPESAASGETHDAGDVRVNYVVAQMPEFANSFNCPVGSPMNPVKRCSLW